MNTSTETIYFRIYRTINQMMRDRGYIVDPDNLDLQIEKFKLIFANDPRNLNEVFQNAEGERIMACFDPIDRLDTKTVQSLVKKMEDSAVPRMVLVGNNGIATPSGLRVLESYKSLGSWIEFFEFDEVVINITEHELVPKHEPLSEKEKAEVLSRYSVKETQLPRILRTDPVAKYLGVKPGQILKITRKSDTAGTYVTYRLVY
jgi:DNA-directed RNA polymerase I, II, and III subunit RPABC1